MNILTTKLRFSIALSSMLGLGQIQSQTLSLETAISRAEAAYPALRQQGLIRQSEQLSQENLNRQLLPQLSIAAQATYQSDVTQLRIPNAPFQVEPLSKDQYRAVADLSQIVYDGGQISAQRKLSSARSNVETERISVEKHLLSERIQQLYFGILQAESQIKLLGIVEADLKTGIQRTEAQLAGGTAYRSALALLKAESLRLGQKRRELEATGHGLRKALGVLTNHPLNDSTSLELPGKPAPKADITRPETAYFDAQQNATRAEKKLIDVKTIPKASLFVQGGYGRPGLNMLQNEFAWFGLGGVRLNWQIQGLYTAKRDRAQSDIKAATIKLQQETFQLNNLAQIQQQEAELDDLNDMIAADEEIIRLRQTVKEAALAQLEAGVITASDYLREVHAEETARQENQTRILRRSQTIHRIHWLKGGK
jgi:outer membrane protein TolC